LPCLSQMSGDDMTLPCCKPWVQLQLQFGGLPYLNALFISYRQKEHLVHPNKKGGDKAIVKTSSLNSSFTR